MRMCVCVTDIRILRAWPANAHNYQLFIKSCIMFRICATSTCFTICPSSQGKIFAPNKAWLDNIQPMLQLWWQYISLLCCFTGITLQGKRRKNASGEVHTRPPEPQCSDTKLNHPAPDWNLPVGKQLPSITALSIWTAIQQHSLLKLA